MRAAWRVSHDRRAVHHKTQKIINAGGVAWRSILSRRAVSGQMPRFYKQAREMKGKLNYHDLESFQTNKRSLNKHEQLPLPGVLASTIPNEFFLVSQSSPLCLHSNSLSGLQFLRTP